MSSFSEEQKKSIIKKHHNKLQKSRLNKIKTVTLRKLLGKNPYLYASRNISTPDKLINSLLTDFLTSSEETMFGEDFFESLGLEISGGVVSTGQGTDFSIEQDSEIHVYSFKSGPNIQNASAAQKQGEEFTETSQRLYKTKKRFDPVRIHGYGKTSSLANKKTPYRKIAGQAAWQELTGCSDFHIMINEVISQESVHYAASYQEEYEKKLADLTNQFNLNFPSKNGKIDWSSVTEFNSGIKSKGKKLKS